MTYTRRNVWNLGGDFNDPNLLWYARGVAAMKARALAEPTAWRFYGAIHGIESQLWTQLGYLSNADQMPSSALQATFWNQCQHGSWYFLPWHRGYLLAFEAIIRDAVVKRNGPSTWSLPYWNYFRSNESKIPPAFSSPDWPDGTGNNPLFVSQRYGPRNDGNVYVPLNQVNLKPMADQSFTGVYSGGSRGFGGPDTGFAHGGQNHGGVESEPHDMVHGLVGGGTQQKPGLMSDPDTAGLDPIFWLHHANIDRLWEVWRQNPSTNSNPTDPSWLGGPASNGGQAFAMPMPDGTTWNYTPADMVDLGKLEYTYDDFTPDVTVPSLRRRLVALGLNEAAARGTPAMTSGNNVELIGANNETLRVTGAEAHATVHLDSTVRKKMIVSLNVTGQHPDPDRVFLNLENVRGKVDSTVIDVYVCLPQDSQPAEHPELQAGSVGLFGVRKASLPNEEHGGSGLNFAIEVTDIVDALHMKHALDVDSIDVRLVPIRPVPDEDEISIGRVSLYRQGR